MTKIPVWTEKKLSKAKVVGGGGMPMISVTVLTLTLSIFASRLWLFFLSSISDSALFFKRFNVNSYVRNND